MKWVLLKLDPLASPSTTLPSQKYLAKENKRTSDPRPVEKWNIHHVHGPSAKLWLHYVVKRWSFIKEDHLLNVCRQPPFISHVSKSPYLVIAFYYQATKCYDE
jgi:hypothetical protein